MAHETEVRTPAPVRKATTLDYLRALNREPFTEVLARLMAAEPTQENVEAWANQHPDRWASAIKTMAQLSGFHEKIEVDQNFTFSIQQSSDVDLETRLKELQAILVEGEFEEVSAPDKNTSDVVTPVQASPSRMIPAFIEADEKKEGA